MLTGSDMMACNRCGADDHPNSGVEIIFDEMRGIYIASAQCGACLEECSAEGTDQDAAAHAAVQEWNKMAASESDAFGRSDGRCPKAKIS